jgi:hypothetical protein
MSWSNTAVHQDFGSTGRYNADSAIAKEYAGLEEDSGSRVDDGAGWRQIKKDSPPKTAAEYEALVNQYSAAGFDVKAIDMDGDNFTNSNIAIKPKDHMPPTSDTKPDEMEMSPEYAEAKARISQYQEDVSSGRTADELFGDAPDATSFLDRYRMKLGQRMENGNYRPPKLKDVAIKSEADEQESVQ